MDKIDLRLKLTPSDLEQHFAPVNITLLWAHYFWLTQWSFKDLSAPFWRIYWNDRPGAVISIAGQDIALTSEHVYLLSPNTPFSSRIMDTRPVAAGGINRMEGGLVVSQDHDPHAKTETPAGALRHFSLHFLLGIPYDMLSGKVYRFVLSAAQQEEISGVIALIAKRPGRFAFHQTLRIQAFVTETILRIPAEDWVGLVNDPRVLSVLLHIEKAQGAIPSNQELAESLNMTTDSFIRLFRKSIGMTPHRYAIIKRLVKTAILLHHTNNSIDAIAAECGFDDRNYFTRLFTNMVGMSPARYRKVARSQSP